VSSLNPPKHLVLDDDVHRALKRKKRETGINVKNLGNCALRTVLERPLLVEAIGEKLVAAGCLSEEAFDALRRDAIQELCASAEDVASIVRRTDEETLATGSWEIRELARNEDEGYQVVSAWVRDRRMRPITLHKHDGVEFLILLKGAVLVTLEMDSQIVTAPGAVTVPCKTVHSVTPLEFDTRMVCVLSPLEPGYVTEDAA